MEKKELDRKTYSVKEFAQITGLGRNAAYNALHRKEVAFIKLGGRLLILRSAVDRMLEQN